MNNFKLDRTLFLQLPQSIYCIRDHGVEGVSVYIDYSIEFVGFIISIF